MSVLELNTWEMEYESHSTRLARRSSERVLYHRAGRDVKLGSNDYSTGNINYKIISTRLETKHIKAQSRAGCAENQKFHSQLLRLHGGSAGLS